MSIIALHKLCRDVLRDRAFRAAMASDPAAASAKYDLTPHISGLHIQALEIQ